MIGGLIRSVARLDVARHWRPPIAPPVPPRPPRVPAAFPLDVDRQDARDALAPCARLGHFPGPSGCWYCEDRP